MPSTVHPETHGDPFRVLFVCTGNICRSPMAERYAQAYVAEHLGEASAAIAVRSAGSRAVIDGEMHPNSASVLRGIGGDPTGFRARELTTVTAEQADLVLAMTRDHRRAVLGLAPRALARSFTLLEAADLVGLIGADVDLPGDTFPDRCRALVKAMSRSRSRRPVGRVDEIIDPNGRSLGVHEQVGERITSALDPLLARLVSLRPATVSGFPGVVQVEPEARGGMRS